MPLKGSYLLEPKIYFDERGYFFENFNNKKLMKITNGKKFIQGNHSYSKKNILRGIHFQFKNPQYQIFYLVKGELDIYLIDFRPNSKTFLKNVFLNLNFKKNQQILTPPGVGCGFLTKSNENIVIYFVSEFYNPKNEIGVKWNDELLNLKWNCSKPIISNKDKLNNKLSDIKFEKFKDLNNIKI